MNAEFQERMKRQNVWALIGGVKYWLLQNGKDWRTDRKLAGVWTVHEIDAMHLTGHWGIESAKPDRLTE